MFTRHSRFLKAVSVAVVFLFAGFYAPGLATASIGGLQISKAVAHDFEAHRFDYDRQIHA